MIKVFIEFYGQLRELNNEKEPFIKIEENSNCQSLLDKLEGEFPKFQKFRKYVICAVNNELVDENYILKDEDRVAVLPPVSGG